MVRVMAMAPYIYGSPTWVLLIGVGVLVIGLVIICLLKTWKEVLEK